MLLDQADQESTLWSTDDLQDILSHQWAAPLALDLGGLQETFAERVETLAASKGLLLRSFGDLLEHKRPPLELLELTKEFAKRSIAAPCSSIPHDVARVIYFSSIAAALCHCGRRITTLSDQRITDGISWALSLNWLEDNAREVLSSGLQALEKQAGDRE